MKTCTRCNEAKRKTEFHKQASRKDGLRSHCKACAHIHAAKTYAANAEKIKINKAAYRAENVKKIKAQQAEYRAANRSRIRADHAAYCAANQGKIKAHKAAYLAAHPDKRKESCKTYRSTHQEEIRIHDHNRRARKRASGGKLSQGITDKLFKLQRGMCACCGKSLGKRFHIDHIMPLALGGYNTDDNIQLLRTVCNLQKNAKHPVDFMQERGFLL